MNEYKAARQRLKGPVVPINVCFTEDDAVDFPAMRKYVDWLCRQKVPVLMLTYGSSEFSSLTDAEICGLTEELAEVTAGRALFIASTGWWCVQQCREFLQRAKSAGVDVVKVQIHPWLPKERDIIVGFFDRIQDAADIPLLAWGHAPPAFPIAVAAELAQRPNVIGIKNDGDPFYDFYDLIRDTRDRNFAVISGGQMRNFAYGHPIGSAAYLCTVAPFRPDIALEFYNHLVAKRQDDAWEMVYRYEEPWLKVAGSMDWLCSIKTAMHLYGLFPHHRVRSPRPSHSAAQRAQIRQCLEQTFGPIERFEL